MLIKMLTKCFATFFFLAVILKFSNTGEADPLPYDYPDRDHETAVCTAVQTGESKIQLDLDKSFKYEDALKLLSWNLKYDFGSGKTKPTYGTDLASFKISIIEALFKGLRSSCPDEFVSHRLLRIMEQFNLIYQNSFSSPSNSTNEWGKIPQRLTECANKVTDAGFLGSGPLIEKVNVMMEDGTAGSLPIFPPMEYADLEYEQMDLIIDTLWWAFVNAYGNCYNYVNPTWAAKLKELFENDFIKPLAERWMDGGLAVDYGIMMGDFQIDRFMINMRYCAASTFIVRTIVDKQIVRPLEVVDSNGQLGKNARTGEKLM